MIDLFFYKFYETDNYYHYHSLVTRQMFPLEYLTHDDIYPLNRVEFNLYLPDGLLYDKLLINTPNNSIIYLNRIYPNWLNQKKIYTPHNYFYKFLFNNYHIVYRIKKYIMR